jgi:hypothetical protein
MSPSEWQKNSGTHFSAWFWLWGWFCPADFATSKFKSKSAQAKEYSAGDLLVFSVVAASLTVQSHS